MNLDEEFKKLGYTEKYENEWNIKYRKRIEKNSIWTDSFTIDFMLGDEEVYKYDGHVIAVPITYKELQLINKKIEELKWGDKNAK